MTETGLPELPDGLVWYLEPFHLYHADTGKMSAKLAIAEEISFYTKYYNSTVGLLTFEAVPRKTTKKSWFFTTTVDDGWDVTGLKSVYNRYVFVDENDDPAERIRETADELLAGFNDAKRREESNASRVEALQKFSGSYPPNSLLTD